MKVLFFIENQYGEALSFRSLIFAEIGFIRNDVFCFLLTNRNPYIFIENQSNESLRFRDLIFADI